MKKTVISIAALAAISAVSFAQTNPAPAQTAQTQQVSPAAKTAAVSKEAKKAEVIFGDISAVNTEKNEITLKVKKDKTDKTFSVEQKEMAKLKVGEEVKIKLIDGKVESIKPVMKHEVKNKKHENKTEAKQEKPAENK